MSTLITLVTALKTAETSAPIVAALFTSDRTSLAIPYKFVASLADDNNARKLALSIIAGETIDIDALTARDASIKHDARYMSARAKETPDLVRTDKNGQIVPRRTTPAALVKRFIVPAIETYLDSAILDALGLDVSTLTAEHVASIVKTKATTSVEAKLTHYTRGTTTADKASHNARKLSRAEKRRAAKARREVAKETSAA